MGFRHTLRLAASAVAISVVATGCGGSSAPASQGEAGSTTLRIGLLPIVHVAPVILGQKKGFFEEEGIDLEITYATTSAAIVPSIMSDELDLGYGNMTSTILARAEGLPIVSIASADSATMDPKLDTNAVIVKADSPYEDAADLEGRTVAVNALQASNYLTVRASADELGADSSAYKFVEVPFPDMLSNLESGNVDAANVTEPFFTQARRSGDYRALYYTLNIAGTRPGFVSDSYYTSLPVYEKKAQAMDAFERAITKSKSYANEHPDEVREVVTEYTQIPAEIIPDITLPFWPTEDIPQDDVAYMVKLMQKYGLLEGNAPGYDEIVQQ